MNTFNTEPDASILEEASAGPDLIALGLLRLQQRFEAFDQLYNEEIGNLVRELAQIKADYVRLYQARSAPRRRKSARGRVAHGELPA